MKHETDIVVLGAGWVGLCAALSMAERGLAVVLLDRRDLTQSVGAQLGRVYALNTASLALMRTLKTLDNLPSHAMNAYERMRVWVAQSGAEIDFDARLLGCSELGVIAEEAPFIHTLFKQVQSHPNIIYVPETKIESVVMHPSCIQLRSQQASWQAKLTMVADGAQSNFRQQLNVPLTQWSYHQEALVTTVELEKPHHNTCYQVFLEEGPLAFLPLVHPYQCAIVWSNSLCRAQILSSMDEIGFNQALTQPMYSRLGNIRCLGPRTRFPLTMRHTQSYVGERWLLLGDAAHTIHPMAGLGLNMGLADIQCWLNYFDKEGFNNLSHALNAYQRERKTKVWETLMIVEGLKTVFSTPFSPIKVLRDVGLQICQTLPMVKRFFIERATQV